MPKRIANEMMCGCHTTPDRGIVYCERHASVGKLMALLDALRTYFLETTGEQSPFVQRIDELVPRRD